MATSKNQEREAREARERLKRYSARQAVHNHQSGRRKRDNIFAVIGVVLVAAAAAGVQIFYFTGGPGTPVAAPSSSASPSASAAPQKNIGAVPAATTAEARTWTGSLRLNDTKIGISLDGKAAPQAVASFIGDVKNKYFLDKSCHRLVVSDSAGLLQCGSADGAGGPDPDYSFGPIENAGADGKYAAGVIAIARNSDNAYSNGHQFFIVFDESTLPDDSVGGYSIIGKVTSGLAALKKDIVAGGIKDVAPFTDASGAANDGTNQQDGAPVVATTITGATIK